MNVCCQQYLLPEKQLPPSPDTSLEAAKPPEEGCLPTGHRRMVLIREPVSIFKRMNKTLGQEALCCVRSRQGQLGEKLPLDNE